LSLINLFIEANIQRSSPPTLWQGGKKSQKLIVSLNTLSLKNIYFFSALHFTCFFAFWYTKKKNLVSFCKHLLLVEISMRGEVEREKKARLEKEEKCMQRATDEHY
jgi:hypothetical protein